MRYDPTCESAKAGTPIVTEWLSTTARTKEILFCDTTGLQAGTTLGVVSDCRTSMHSTRHEDRQWPTTFDHNSGSSHGGGSHAIGNALARAADAEHEPTRAPVSTPTIDSSAEPLPTSDRDRVPRSQP